MTMTIRMNRPCCARGDNALLVQAKRNRPQSCSIGEALVDFPGDVCFGVVDGARSLAFGNLLIVRRNLPSSDRKSIVALRVRR